jgi:S1-C subfamily serine protease
MGDQVITTTRPGPMTNRFKATATIAALLVAFDTAHGQQMTMTRSDARVMAVAPGLLLVLRAEASAVTIDGVVADSGGGAPVDLQRGDRITSFQGIRGLTIERIMAAYDSATTGTEIAIGIVRTNASERVVRFSKPAVARGAPRTIAVGAGVGTGAWASSAAAAAAFEIAGAHIRENDQGMPEVSHRASHPAAATVPLRVGDVVTAIDGRKVAALAGLTMHYERATVGAEVRLTVARGKDSVEVKFNKPAK